ncbi:S-methyl-5-thioribose kinase [Lactobacillus sp. ESL0677]|uniref:S-methyl-5-thioribose kinase n=1 Tax=Lactobacillus sp. ESL0677 TaxID=2983208 RepID=UPI0023F76FFB|nr:S-methyl-5-thioribose kinase [Lactobacillus sp. ESL0677]WEV36118.1 S-methyl-5-thioribose kinase [Lactobacillus sp. ESL0677]
MDYSKHFLLNTETVKQYVKDKTNIFDGTDVSDLKSKEISDGNINYVYSVANSQKSVVVKQADNKIRTSGRELDRHRNVLEYKTLSIEGKLTNGMVPKMYNYDETMSAIIMEDVSAYKNLRKELHAEKIFPKLAEQISSFMVDALLPTTDLIFDRHQKKNVVKEFINVDLCDITEDLVLTEPYYNYKNRNTYDSALDDFVKQNLYENDELKANVAELRNNFMNNAQALLHGDLHSGSIFINQNGIKIIDPEFAFYGPIGYDIGNVIGNLVFPLVVEYSKKENKNSEFMTWLENTIEDVFDLTIKKLYLKYDKLVEFPLYKERKFENSYISSIIADSLGYAGTEIIRRTVGDSKVLEITSITNVEQRNIVSMALIKIGTDLILNRKLYSAGNQLISDIAEISDSII